MGNIFAQGLERKLGFREDQRIALIGASQDVVEHFATEFNYIDFSTTLRGGFDIIVFFATRNFELEKRITILTRSLRPKGALWIAWPKKTSRIVTDLNFDVVQEIGLAQSLVATKVCSISEVWSSLRFTEKRTIPSLSNV